VGADPLPPAQRAQSLKTGATSTSPAAASGGIGVVVALAAEAQALVRRRYLLGVVEQAAPGVRVLVCGMGPRAAADAAATLAQGGVAALAMFGVAGGLDPALAPGALLAPAEVIDEQGLRYATDAAWRARLIARFGAAPDERPLLTVESPLLGPQDKRLALQRWGAPAVDMESAAVARIARARKLPFLALRAVADAAGDRIPGPLAAAIDRYGRPRTLALATALLRNPGLLAELPHLASTMNRASAALRRAVQAAGPGLAYSA
jgi:nucleoside phosphorylase